MIVVVEKDGNLQEARILADKLNIPLVREDSSPEESEDLILRFHKEGLSLCGEGLEMQGDLTHMIPRLKKNNLQREFLVKASRIKNLGDHPVAVDATAGMGEDSLLLAAAGYQVILYELNPVIAALLKDSLRRASHIPELEDIVGRMQVREGDSIQGLSGLETTPDLILLDPMFPERKKSGLIKKKFQLLQKLESPCSD
ncbi:MAG: class I SAM-dependent methyltransferase, partial [Eubacterium sp.]|nr:class I SAM-dependent methyltransferase [Eubacterium sp.]